jgi:hypothetical protein
MPFTHTETKEGKTFNKVPYLRLTAGQHTIRILDKVVEPVDTHFIMGKMTVKCLEDECPICDNNKRILMENKETFRDVPGWAPKSKRWVLNILDRSLVKICPNKDCACPVKKQGENFPPQCPECGAFLNAVQIEQYNKVQIMSCGVTLAEQLNQIEASVQDEAGNVLGWTSYDINLIVTGSGRKKVVTPIPTRHDDVVEIPADQLADTSQATLSLNADEIIDLLKGVSLKDIFTARKSGKLDEVTEEAVSEISEEVNNILK